MKTYAVWFEGNKVKKVEDVTEQYEKLVSEGVEGENAADILQDETKASAVAVGHDKTEVIAEAAEIMGIEEIE
jgi:hypothetical protein